MHYWGQAPQTLRVIMAGIARALDRIYNKMGLQIVFVPMVNSDEAAIEEVRAVMDAPGVMPEHGYRPDLTVGLIQNAALCMTMKHHPIIFAMAAAVPTVSMTFDDTTKEVFDKRVEIAKAIAEVVEELRQRSGEVIKKFLAER